MPITVVLFDEDDEGVASYAPFRQVRDLGHEGLVDLNWLRSFPDDQEGAVTGVLDYDVDAAETTSAEVDFPLADVQVGRS